MKPAPTIDRRAPLRLRAAVLAGLVALVAAAPAATAQDTGRQADEDACRPDVFRLCASEIPDEAAIVACLNAKPASLSPACRAVMGRPPVARRAGVQR